MHTHTPTAPLSAPTLPHTGGTWTPISDFFPLLQGGEVTRASDLPQDLHSLPPPLLPTLPASEPHSTESRLPQPLPPERRGHEELEVPGRWRRDPGWVGGSMLVTMGAPSQSGYLDAQFLCAIYSPGKGACFCYSKEVGGGSFLEVGVEVKQQYSGKAHALHATKLCFIPGPLNPTRNDP